MVKLSDLSPVVKETCNKCGSEWVEMDWQEAYPASSGIKCSNEKCGNYKLGWGGFSIRKEKPKEPEGATWVNCPICDQPDMLKETDSEGFSLIFCTNHACRSNGGDYEA